MGNDQLRCLPANGLGPYLHVFKMAERQKVELEVCQATNSRFLS